MTRMPHLAQSHGPDLDPAERMRKEMGRELKAMRLKVGLLQRELAGQLAYSRSSVASAESGIRDLGRPFWEQCDDRFGTASYFAAWYDRARFGTDMPSELNVASALKAPGLAEAAEAYLDLGWPVSAQADGTLTLSTGQAADALEVPAAIGELAARWWFDTDGAQDTVRGLPALPAPGTHLAAISTGARWYFLVRAGQSPWQTASADAGSPAETGRPAQYPSPPDPRIPASPVTVIWHADGSRIPAPPAGPARWEFLPSRSKTFRLCPPHAVAYLLDRAATAVPGGTGFILPGGARVVPAARPASGIQPGAAALVPAGGEGL